MMSLGAQRRRVERCQRQWRQRSAEFAVRRSASLKRMTGWMRVAPWALGGVWLVHRLTRSEDDASSQSDLTQAAGSDQASGRRGERSSEASPALDQLNEWLNLLGNAVQIYMLCSDAFPPRQGDSASSAEDAESQQQSQRRSADQSRSGDPDAAR